MEPRTQGNPMLPLIEQLQKMAEQSATGIPVLLDYEAIVHCVIRAMREEQQRMDRDPERIITQCEAHKRYGKKAISTLVKRGLLQRLGFDVRERYDENGDLVRLRGGAIYYRTADIECAIDKGNVLKDVGRMKGRKILDLNRNIKGAWKI